MTTTAKLKKDFNKRFGEGTLRTFHDKDASSVQPVPTGIPSFDYATGIGGMPLGRIVELYGPESSGKTTIALKTTAEFQKRAKDPDHPFYDRRVGFIDAEHSLDPLHMEAIGVDISEETGVLVNQPDYGEQGYDIVEAMIHSGQFGMIVIDSLPAMIPKKILDGSAEDQDVGSAARLNGKLINKIKGIAQKNDVLVIFINQIREKVGVMYGSPETTPGGRALKFFASMRIDVRRKEIKKSDTFIGQTMNVKIKKNKVFRPFTTSSFDYYWDTGIDVVKDIMQVAIDMEIIKRAGAYYYYGEDAKNPLKDTNENDLKWQGKDTLEQVLKNSPALYEYTNNMVQGNIPKDAVFVEEQDDDVQEKEEAQEELQEDIS